MIEESKLVFAQLGNALQRLEEAANAPVHENRFEIDTTIHRFEFTIELFWKALKKKLVDDHGIEVHSPKSVLQQAYLNKLIDNEHIWLNMLSDRNLTSHCYKQALADQIYQNIKTYVPFLKTEFEKCFQLR